MDHPVKTGAKLVKFIYKGNRNILFFALTCYIFPIPRTDFFDVSRHITSNYCQNRYITCRIVRYFFFSFFFVTRSFAGPVVSTPNRRAVLPIKNIFNGLRLYTHISSTGGINHHMCVPYRTYIRIHNGVYTLSDRGPTKNTWPSIPIFIFNVFVSIYGLLDSIGTGAVGNESVITSYVFYFIHNFTNLEKLRIFLHAVHKAYIESCLYTYDISYRYYYYFFL